MIAYFFPIHRLLIVFIIIFEHRQHVAHAIRVVAGSNQQINAKEISRALLTTLPRRCHDFCGQRNRQLQITQLRRLAFFQTLFLPIICHIPATHNNLQTDPMQRTGLLNILAENTGVAVPEN
ncbi:MAG: hypothetical protein Q8R51_09130, partial [Azonexus sp.]|nr:hypothetical protein [Azonexus sp.]